MGMNLSPDETLPCRWAPAEDELYRAYHDEEWGVPEYDPRALWEKLQLDGMQAGLSWVTILRKRDAIREEFDSFIPEQIAMWDQERIEKALTNPGIIRSPTKIKATIGNARAFLAMQEKGEDFSKWLWSFTGGAPIVNHLRDITEVPAKTPLSEEIAKALKARGFKFCGSVIVYAFMQAVGMVNNHETRCPRHAEIQELHS